jgi:hypothetical protein
LAKEFCEWEDQYGDPIEIFIQRAVGLSSTNSQNRERAANSSLSALAEAVA